MAGPGPDGVLRFRPLQSCVDVTFWSELSNRKLDQYKLSETPIDVHGLISASRYKELGSSLQVLSSSFEQHAGTTPQGSHAAPGQLLLLNTTEAFNSLDKAAAIKQVGAQIWHDILSGAAEAQPHLLQRFLLLVHGDLKHFVFSYWFAFPALKPPQPFRQLSAQPLTAAYPTLQQQVCAAADAWRYDNTPAPTSSAAGSSSSAAAEMFCLMSINPATDAVSTAGLSNWQQLQQTAGTPLQDSASRAAAGLDTAAAAAAAAGPQIPAAGGDAVGGLGAASDVVLVMFDPCCDPYTPGWPLRNVLLLAALRWGVRQLKVLCVRDSNAGRADAERCFVLEVGLPEVPANWHRGSAPAAAATPAAAVPAAGSSSVPEVLGWEANSEGRLRARVVDLSPLMSPLQLADQAVDLNLRLMRWRAAPDLDMAALAATRCLLLGAGTLGCAVARCLLAWGVRHITFVDSATVSFSNPVRQSLFTYADCLGGGKAKAAAAAEALRSIFPSVQAGGLDLTIPMPGHPPANANAEAGMKQAAEQLQQLVSDHDVVFLLTDTRESRWLPSMLAAAAGKLAITAALGFDTFLVMRHGLPAAAATAATAAGGGRQDDIQPEQLQQRQRLGCYFCNDVVAPLNSTIDRTLDQQCTVARPGLAPIAGSLTVELMAAALQHPLKGHAPAPYTPSGAGSNAGSSAAAVAAAGALGPVPHMVRGQLSGFGQTCMVGQAFSQCTACSDAVLQQYKEEGWPFILKVLQQPGSLEELTGLAELHRQTAALDLSSASADEGGVAGGEEGEEDWTEL